MTPRISLRPAGPAAVLIAFVAAVLALLSVTQLTFKNSADPVLSVSANVLHQVEDAGQAGPSVRNRPISTASPTSHRSSVQTSERRVTTASLGQGTEIHHPGGSPDAPNAALTARDRLLPTALSDLPIDASAQVIATTVRLSHRGRAPPTAGYGVPTPLA